MKLCRRCGVTKPAKDFYKSKANADGLDGRCKGCDALQCSERRRRKTRVAVRTPPMLLEICSKNTLLCALSRLTLMQSQ